MLGGVRFTLLGILAQVKIVTASGLQSPTVPGRVPRGTDPIQNTQFIGLLYKTHPLSKAKEYRRSATRQRPKESS